MGDEGLDGKAPAAKRGRWDPEEPKNGGEGVAEVENGGAKAASAPKAKLPLPGLAALQKAKEALKMQKKIAEKLKGLKQKGIAIPDSKASGGPKPLRLDGQGREIDEEGNLVDRGDAGLAAKKAKVGTRKEAKAVATRSGDDGKEAEEEDEYLDPRMRSAPGVRKKRATLQFVQEGQFQKMAQRERMRSKFAVMGHAGASPSTSKFVGNANNVPLGARAGAGTDSRQEVEEVSVEWWDANILETERYLGEGDRDPRVIASKITSYIEHPVPIQPPNEAPEPEPQPLKLTKKEQRKLRTQQRQAREKEKQEMIRQGLLEPPKPKVKLSNLVRVLGAEGTQDPTKIEKEVMAQMGERQQAHEDRNVARKLTPAERREKKMKKMFDPENGLFLAVFKVRTLRNPQHKYKVNVNATENMLTGCVLTGTTYSLIIIEGCAKSVVRYKKLMLKRIQWDAWLAGEDAPQEMEGNSCKLLWEGTVQSQHFNKFMREVDKTDASARQYLAGVGLAHLWDLASAKETT